MNSEFRRFATVGFFGPPNLNFQTGYASQSGDAVSWAPTLGVRRTRPAAIRRRLQAGSDIRHDDANSRAAAGADGTLQSRVGVFQYRTRWHLAPRSGPRRRCCSRSRSPVSGTRVCVRTSSPTRRSVRDAPRASASTTGPRFTEACNTPYRSGTGSLDSARVHGSTRIIRCTSLQAPEPPLTIACSTNACPPRCPPARTRCTPPGASA